MDLEVMLGYILIIGVIIGLIFLTLGLALYCYSHGFSIDFSQSIEYRDLIGWILALPSLPLLQKIISIGLIAIIITPYIRVLASLAWFTYFRDLKFIAFTSFVAVMLTLSILGILRTL
ncbi:MAG: DUF1634 domain-containing protein [Sulfolobales archaeon]